MRADHHGPGVQQFAVLLMAGLAGLALGLAWTVTLSRDSLSSGDQTYPLRVSLPQVTLPSIPGVTGAEDARATEPGNVAADPAAPSIETHLSTESASVSADRVNPAPVPLRLRPGGMLAVDYDLAQFASARSGNSAPDGSIETSMPLLVDGISKGSARIRVADNAQILIAAGTLAQALGERGKALSPSLSARLERDTGFIPFHDLRAAGIDVRYDAAKDHISLTLPS